MGYITILVILLHTNVLCNGTVNYCGSRMCAYTNSHTFCQYPVGPSPSCIGYVNSTLSHIQKSRILARLNRRRSEVARGVHGWPSAGDMLKLRWIEDLAREAQRWADQCAEPMVLEEYDICRDLYSISVGQCVASVVGEAPGLRPETMIDIWYMQGVYYNGNITSYITSKDAIKYYGEFAQMIWSHTYLVGCGKSSFMMLRNGRLRSVERLVCNFAPRGPPPLRAMWSPASPGSQCPPRSRPDDELPALCAFQHNVDEVYDDNGKSLPRDILLNTVMEIEKNLSMDRLGILDEIYLTKLAVSSMQNALLTPAYNSEQKKYIDTLAAAKRSFLVKLPNQIKGKKNKQFFAGRPKAYRMEDLNSFYNDRVTKESVLQEKTAIRDNYGDYEFIDTSDLSLLKTDSSFDLKHENVIESIENVITSVISEDVSSVSYKTNVEEFSTYHIDIVSNFNITQILNKTLNDDVFSDPETVRQLEEALNRMEKEMAETSSSGKVRRELKTELNPNKIVTNNLNTKARERNQSLERGPMLNMVLKYLPYLKPYEKSIIGHSSNRATVVLADLTIITILTL